MNFTEDWFETKNRRAIWQSILAPFAGRPGLNVLEIGSFEGRSAAWLLEHVANHPSSLLTCIDAWIGFDARRSDAFMREVEQRFDANIMTGPNGNRVRKIKSDTTPALASLITACNRFEVVYIDACHCPAQATSDIVMAWHLTVPGGVIIIDDYGSTHANHAGLKHAVDVFINEWATRVEVIHTSYQVIIRRR